MLTTVANDLKIMNLWVNEVESMMISRLSLGKQCGQTLQPSLAAPLEEHQF